MPHIPDLRTLALRLIAQHGVDAFDLHQVDDRVIVVAAFTCRTDDKRRRRIKPVDKKESERRSA